MQGLLGLILIYAGPPCGSNLGNVDTSAVLFLKVLLSSYRKAIATM